MTGKEDGVRESPLRLNCARLGQGWRTCRERRGSMILTLGLLGCLSRWKVMTAEETSERVTMYPVESCLHNAEDVETPPGQLCVPPPSGRNGESGHAAAAHLGNLCCSTNL